MMLWGARTFGAGRFVKGFSFTFFVTELESKLFVIFEA
jgi:hypothetical protein